MTSSTSKPERSTAWRRVKRILIGAAIVVALLLVWGVGIEPRLFEMSEETAEIPGLPAAWEGRRVALIADFQMGMWMNNTDTARRVVARLAEERPAAVLVAGDFIYSPGDDEPERTLQEELAESRPRIAEVTEIVRPLVAAGIPTLAVLGNHDYCMMYSTWRPNELVADDLRRSLEAAGVQVIDNAAVPLSLTTGGSATEADAANRLYVVGVGSRWANDAKAEVALSQVPDTAPRLALMHEPDSFESFPAGAAPLALAGHTHGGQVRIPFLPHFSWMALINRGDIIMVDGWINDYGQPGNRLYVNRGIGFSSFPVRISCRPEVTMFTLRRAG